MPGTYRQLRLDIWVDQEWRALTHDEQYVYLLLLSHPKLTAAGVIDQPLYRLKPLAADLDPVWLGERIGTLCTRRYLVRDADTDETLVRSFIRNDGMINGANHAKAIATAFRLIESPVIQQAVIVELSRLVAERPEANGWDGIAAQDPDLMAKIGPPDRATVTPIRKGSGKGSGNPSANPSGNRSRKGSPKGSGSP